MSVELLDSMGSDLAVVNAARVSFHKESDWEGYEYDRHDGHGPGILSDKDQKLISYLAKHNHWSPFTHTSLQFRISAPIFVARQLVKHQVGGVWNEVSRRYVDDEPVFYFPDVWRGKPVNAKQGSSDRVIDVHPSWWVEWPEQVVESCLDMYSQLVLAGVAPEQARMILPQNTMTEWIWTGSLYFFARVCKLRLDSHAQKESQDVAKMIYNLIPAEFQYSWKALMNET